MKKLLLMALVVLCAQYAKADSFLSLRSGNPQVFLVKSKASFEVDWDHARVTNWDNKLFPQYLKHRGDDFVRDWPKDREKAEQYFTVRLNKKSSGMKIEEDGGSTDYKMIIRLSKIDVGDGASGFVPYSNAKAGGVIMDGTLELRDRAGKLLCVLDINEAKGVGHPSETVRYGMTLFEVANALCDFMKDVKKGKVKGTAVVDDTPVVKEEPVAETKAATKAKTTKKVVKQEPLNMYRVTAQKVNVRSAANTKSTIVGSLVRDELVEVKDISGSWATVSYKGGTRYVSANYLEKVAQQEEVEEEVEEEEVEEKAIAIRAPERNDRQVEEKSSKSSKKEKKAKEKKAKARDDDDDDDDDGGSRFPSFKPDAKYMGEWHIGYATTGHINGYKTYTAHVQTGFLQGVSLNEYLEFGIGIDVTMNTHYRHGGDFGDIAWTFAPYAHVRGYFPVKPKVKPFMSFGVGPGWTFLPDFISKPGLYLEFGPGIRWKQFNLFLGLQKTGTGAGSNHFISKVGWYF